MPHMRFFGVFFNMTLRKWGDKLAWQCSNTRNYWYLRGWEFTNGTFEFVSETPWRKIGPLRAISAFIVQASWSILGCVCVCVCVCVREREREREKTHLHYELLEHKEHISFSVLDLGIVLSTQWFCDMCLWGDKCPSENTWDWDDDDDDGC